MWDLSFSALNQDSGFWPRLQRRCYGGFRRLSGLSQRFWLSRAYFPFLLWVTLGFAALRQPVYGAMALLGICIWLLVFCRDLLASVTPFLLVFLLSTQRYESLGDFLPCAVLAAPFFAALIWHLMVWPVTFRVGRSATGLLLVSAATLLGGCGILSMHQLLQPLSLYYVGCLGGGMLVFYVLLRSCLTYSKGYDLHRRFAAIFCVLGVCMACLVMLDYAVRWQEFLQVHTTLYLKYRNFATALLLTTLPMSFYLSLKKPAHLLGVAVQAAGLALTGSRSALLFGVALLGLGFVYLVRWGLIPRKAVLPLCVAGAVLAVLVGIFQGGVQALSRSYFTKIIPAEQSGEYFGLMDICGKGASFLGTTLVGVVSQATGDIHLGVGVIAVLFAVGAVLFCLAVRVPPEKA